MIELASKADIAALKALWKKKQPQRSKPSYDHTDPDKMERERLADVPRDAGGKFKAGVTPPKWKGFERVDAEYRASEEKRKLLRPPKVTAKEGETEDQRFDRIYAERFEDKSYYAR